MAETTAYIGLGSNLGDRKNYIDEALKILNKTEKIEVARVSDIIETAPLASNDQPRYLNAVAELKTSLGAKDLRQMLSETETLLGRERRGKWWSRTIDLDILLFGGEIIDSPDLTIPHRQMHLRSFVLKGLCQLNGNSLHPTMKVSFNELAARLHGLDFAPNPELPQLVSIAGVIGVGKTTLAKKLANILNCKNLLEPYDTNPFLPDVYAGKKELALDSQLYFLTKRVDQLNPDILKQGKIFISDYVFDKELIYARRLLDAKQFALYEEIYPAFVTRVTTPVLVIHMRDSAEICLDRIHNRNRPYEQRIKLQFLETLRSDYERLFADCKKCPVIQISTSENIDIEHLANQIKYYTVDHFIIASGV